MNGQGARIPSDQYPDECKRAGCTFVIQHGWEEGDVTFRHGLPDGSVQNIPILDAWLDDLYKDIWEEIRPQVIAHHQLKAGEGATAG